MIFRYIVSTVGSAIENKGRGKICSRKVPAGKNLPEFSSGLIGDPASNDSRRSFRLPGTQFRSPLPGISLFFGF
jgi:hypothetical protein